LALIAAAGGLSSFAGAFWAGLPIALGLAFVGAMLVTLCTHFAGTKLIAAFTCVSAPPVIAMTAVLVLAYLDLQGNGGAFIFIFGASSVFPSLIYGFICMGLVLLLHDRHRDRSMEGFDRTLEASGAWLAAWSGLFALIGLVAISVDSFYLSWAIVCSVTTLLGAFSVSRAVMSRRRRRVWFERVVNGDEPDWQVVKWDPREFDQLVGKLFADEDEMDMVLVHSVTHEHGGPFRHSEEREPYALVSSARVNEIT